jgi:signal transduction histidine kinase
LDLFTQNLISYHQNLTSPVSVSRFNAKDLLDRLVRNFEASKGNSDFSISYSFSGEPELISDEMRIRMAVQNLISNAIAHARPEGGTTEIEVLADNRENQLHVLVKDNGQALPVKKLEWLRDSLEGNLPYESGRGLGSFIVKEVLNKLQGRAAVESTALSGTKVQLTIPLHAGS